MWPINRRLYTIVSLLHLAWLAGEVAAMERRLAAILAADVKGYSHLTELNEEASTAMLRMYRAVVEASISAHGGRIFSSAGDGVVAEFPSPVEAIRCGVEIQNEIAARNAAVPEDGRMQFRIGVNLGDVIAEENNLYGTGVNVAVRLEQLAEPGGICISQTVYDQVRKIVEVPFEDIGERRLKNITEPVHVYRILPSPLPWLKRLISHANIRRQRLDIAAGVLLLLLAVAGGAFYLRQPAALWEVLLSKGATPENAAIAVLPFDNIGNDPRWERFADGITEDIITDLSHSKDLIVIARNSTEVYKGKPVDIRQIGRDLGVKYVLEGSIQSDGERIRVTAQLIQADSGSNIWSERYDRPVNDLFAVQNDVTQGIAATLGGYEGVVADAERSLIRRKPPANLTAFDFYLLGMEAKHRVTKESLIEAEGLFRRALLIDPQLARAYVGLADVQSYLIDLGLAPSVEEAVAGLCPD